MCVHGMPAAISVLTFPPSSFVSHHPAAPNLALYPQSMLTVPYRTIPYPNPDGKGESGPLCMQLACRTISLGTIPYHTMPYPKP